MLDTQRSGAADTAALVRIDALTVSFPSRRGPVRAVNGVSLTVRRGEVLGIVGESGSGKSLTAMSIIDLLPGGASRSGVIQFDGAVVSNADRATLSRLRGAQVGTIFQDPLSSLNPVMTIGAQMVEAVRIHDRTTSRQAARAHATDLLGRVGIKNPAERLAVYPHELSGGMRQRVMIAMAIANSPLLIIADEPTTALDVTTQVQVLRTLEEVRAEVGAAMILISHDLGIIGDTADRVAVMYNGRIIETGPTTQVLSDAQHPYTAGLLQSRPRLDTPRGSVRSIPGSPPNAAVVIVGCSFAPRCHRATDAAGCRSETPPTAAAQAGASAVSCFLPGPTTIEPSLPTSSAAPVASGDLPGAHLHVDGLVKIYPLGRGRRASRLTAVDHLDLEVFPGRTLALVGESGCGKTTAARAVLRLIEPTAGRVTLGDTDFLALSPRELRRARTRAQLIFQDPTSSLNPRQTVGELIAEPMVQQGLLSSARAQARTRELLELVALDIDHLDRYPNELSGGQRQRVAIARALGLEPSVLVLDEPVSALDVSIQAQILGLLADLQRRLGVGYLFISHDLGVVHQLADEIAVMYLGRVVERGAAADILHDPRHPYTQLLVASVPGQRVGEPGGFEASTDFGESPAGCRFASRCPIAELACTQSVPALVAVGSSDADSSERFVACHRASTAAQRFQQVVVR